MDTGVLMLIDTCIPYNSVGDYYGSWTQQPLQGNRAPGAYCMTEDEYLHNMGENRN